MLADMPAWTFFAAVFFAAFLEIIANIMLAKSDGFRKLLPALGAFLFVGLAFTGLAYAVHGMDLAIAYALWGGFGILGTSIGGWLLFGQRLRPTAWLGMVTLISGMALLHLS